MHHKKSSKKVKNIKPFLFKKCGRGEVWCGDSLQRMKTMHAETIDLCFTSPPFPLHRKKSYGNEVSMGYEEWLFQFIKQIKRLLKPTGSLVIDLGCCWEKGRAVRSLYDMRLALKISEELEMPMAQEFYWWNPSRLPTPAQWVTIEKIRLKDSVNKLMWFGKTDKPYANNQSVLIPYSENMEKLLDSRRYSRHMRPSGHKPSKAFKTRNAGAIAGNLMTLSNTNSADPYLKYCRENNLKPHPARCPYELPEFFIRFLTEENGKVLDPFAGSCATGFAAHKNKRRWICIDKEEEFLNTFEGHFGLRSVKKTPQKIKRYSVGTYAE